MAWQKRGSLYVPTAAFAAQDAPSARPELAEIASTRDGRDITRGYIADTMLQQPQDTLLARRGGGDLRLYEEILSDDQVKATFEQRRMSVIANEWTVEAGGDSAADQAAADSLKAQLEAVGWDRATNLMLYGVFYGFAVAEPLWGRDGREVVLDDLRVRDRRRFGWRGDGELVLKTHAKPLGEVLPPRKFWTFAVGADHDDAPYGVGLGHWLYWPAWFKRNGVKFWLYFLEKFGQPTAKGTFPPNAPQQDIDKLLGALEAVRTDAGIAIPEGMAIELLEAARSGTADYTALYDRMNGAISKVVVGQTMTADDGSSRAQADVHMSVRQDLVKADSDLVCESFNRSIGAWLTDWNYPNAAPPRVVRRVEEADDLGALADRDHKLADIGYRPTLERVHDTYGKGYEPFERYQPGPMFAEQDAIPGVTRPQQHDQDQLDSQAEALAGDYERLLGRQVDDIIALAEDSGDLQTLRDRLAQLATAEPPAAVQQALERAGFAAQLVGRTRAEIDAARLDRE